jgi:diaminopimelate epimerase
MPGGTLLVEICDNDEVYLTGEVEGVFDGRFHPDLKEKISRMK